MSTLQTFINRTLITPWLILGALTWSTCATAGFSITSEPMAAKVVVPVSVKPRLILSAGMSLKTAVSSFAGQYGWSVAWNFKDVFVEQSEAFSGANHEEVLAAVLRKYKLVADRFPSDKGYVVYSLDGATKVESPAK